MCSITLLLVPANSTKNFIMYTLETFVFVAAMKMLDGFSPFVLGRPRKQRTSRIQRTQRWHCKCSKTSVCCSVGCGIQSSLSGTSLWLGPLILFFFFSTLQCPFLKHDKIWKLVIGWEAGAGRWCWQGLTGVVARRLFCAQCFVFSDVLSNSVCEQGLIFLMYPSKVLGALWIGEIK